jgi:aspartate racemase
MKTIGLIGGMSWESTQEYYRILNEEVKRRLGGLHSARCVLISVDFAEVEELQHSEDWVTNGKIMAAAAQSLERAGADCVVLCTNTMHKLAREIEESIQIPFLHIADATARRILDQGLVRVGLLGTRFTMEEDFYRGRLEQRYGLEVLIPNAEERQWVHRVIYEELCLGEIKADSRAAYKQIVAGLVKAGAQGVILGCTEIGLLLKPEDSPVPLFDTARLHAESAVDFALSVNIAISPVSEANLEAILAVYCQCEDFLALGPQPHASIEMVRTDLAAARSHGRSYCGIYSPDGEMIGIVDYLPAGFEGQPDQAFLELLMIAAPWRSSGVGNAVVRQVEEVIRKDPQVRVILSGVQVNNPAAIRFWQRQGFTIVSGAEPQADGTIVFRLKKDM